MIFLIFIATLFAQKVPLIIKFNEPAEEWGRETFPIGNGYIGAMIYGKVDQEQIQINDHTLWGGGPGADPAYDGGIKGDAETHHANLQQIRALLQNAENGFNPGGNYESYPGDSRNLLLTLSGDDTSATFGQYQSLTDIEFADTLVEDQAFNITGNCDNPNNGEKMANLFDGSDAKWYPGEDIGFPYIIGWQYGGAVTVSQYILSTANDVPNRDPTAWTLEGSLDATVWTVIDDVTNGNLPQERNTPQTFNLSQAVTFQYFRITITAVRTGQADHAQLSEIKLVTGGGGTPQPYSDYLRYLNVDDSFASVSYTQNGAQWQREYFVSYPANVIVVTVNASAPFSKDIRLRPTQTLYNLSSSADNASLTIQGRPSTHQNAALTASLHYAAELRVESDGKVTVSSSGRGLHVEQGTYFRIYYSSSSNYQLCKDDTFQYFADQDPLPTVQANLAAAIKAGYAAVRAEHVDDYHSLLNRVRLNLPITLTEPPAKLPWNLLTQYNQQNTLDEDLYIATLYYQFGRYLLISSSRPGTLPANLQGMWAEGLTPPWDSDYHLNINMEMNYWPAEATNLAECNVPFIDYIEGLVERGKRVAQSYFCKQDGSPVRGSTFFHASNIWSYAAPKFNTDDAGWFPVGLGWGATHLFDRYRFSQNLTYLQEIYPVLLQASLFWVDTLWTDERDGTLVSNPSFSPEHGPFSLGCTQDQAIVWSVFNNTIEASEILKSPDKEIDEIRAALSKLSSYHVGKNGQFQEWKDEIQTDVSGDGQHRHINHLFPFHPGSQIVMGRSADDDQWINGIKQTLNVRGDGGPGWSKAWKISLWARLHDGEHAHLPLAGLLRESTYPNLLDIQPFQIDGNFGGVAGITEALLQSHGPWIDLIPALPPKWAPSGNVIGLRARGGFEVSIAWTDGAVSGAVITSLAGSTAVVRAKGILALSVTDASGAAVAVRTVDEQTVSWETVVGGVYSLGAGVTA